MLDGVLVVEDDDDIRHDLATILRFKGYNVAEAANGDVALRTLREGARPDVLLLDLMMPVMNGWELRRAMLEDPALAAIPVLVVTGRGALSEAEAALLRPSATLAKPFELGELLALVARYSPRAP